MHYPPKSHAYRTARPALTSPRSLTRATRSCVTPGTDGTDGNAEVARCRTEMAKLLPLWPAELADVSPRGRAHVIAVIERALRAERRRGLAGHWTYNLARHVQLLRAHRAEKAAARANAHSAPLREERYAGKS